MRDYGNKLNPDLARREDSSMVWTNKRETNCKGHYTRDYGIMVRTYCKRPSACERWSNERYGD